MLLIAHNLKVVDLTTNQPPGFEHRILRVRVEGVLRAVTDTANMLSALVTLV